MGGAHFLPFLAQAFFFGAAFLAAFLATFFGAAFLTAFLATFGAALLTAFLAAVEVKEGNVIIKWTFNVLNII